MSELDWSDPMEKCPKCGNNVIQIAQCGHGHCLGCGFTWDYHSLVEVTQLKEGK